MKASKQKWPFIRKRIYPNGTIGYTVDARTSAGGERITFAKKDDAEIFASNRRQLRENEGTDATGNAELKRRGISTQVAINFYLAHLRKQEQSIPLAAAIAELVALKLSAGKSRRYCHDLELRLGRLSQDHGETVVAAIDTKLLDAWLAGLSVAPATRNTFRRDIRTLFSFCMKRGYCSNNPAKGTEAAKLPTAPPSILTPAEAIQMLEASDDDVRAYVAISLFAGIRHGEIQKLDWRQIDLESGMIEVTASNAKGQRRRLVTIEPNLAKWLLPLAKTSGAVAPSLLRKRLTVARRAAGFGRAGTETPEEKREKVKLKRWTEHTERHSFASYWLAKYKDAAALSMQMGNSAKIVFAHYRELVKPAAATAYWQITPTVEQGKIVAMRRA